MSPGRAAVVGIGVLTLGLAVAMGVAMSRGVGKPPTGSVDAGFATAPSFELPRFDGGTAQLSEGERGPAFVYFWASWCAPCKSEAPVIERLWPEYRARGYTFIGVNIMDQEADARRFIDEYHLTFPMARDADGAVYLDYGVYAVPESFFLRPGLQVQEKYLGELTTPILRERLDAIGRPASAASGATR